MDNFETGCVTFISSLEIQRELPNSVWSDEKIWMMAKIWRLQMRHSWRQNMDSDGDYQSIHIEWAIRLPIKRQHNTSMVINSVLVTLQKEEYQKLVLQWSSKKRAFDVWATMPSFSLMLVLSLLKNWNFAGASEYLCESWSTGQHTFPSLIEGGRGWQMLFRNSCKRTFTYRSLGTGEFEQKKKWR